MFLAEAMKATDPLVVKQCYGALSVVFFEAAKSDADVASALTEHSISNEQAKLLAQEFGKNKASLSKLLIKTAYTQSRIVDVSWRLDYYVKSNTIDKINAPIYYVTLVTERPDGAKEDVTFTCNMSEMTDLVSKLRDAAKSGSEERL